MTELKVVSVQYSDSNRSKQQAKETLNTESF